MAEAESLLSQAEQAYSIGDYSRALELAEEAKAKAEATTEEAQSAENTIAEAKSVISQEKLNGLDTAKAETLLSQAEQAYSIGDYNRAIGLAEEAKAKAEATTEDAQSAENTIAEAKSVISQEKLNGLDMAKAEALLSQAEQAYSIGDYSRAFELAEEAKTLALDIDSDGIPNDSDFAPTIKNVNIYAGAAVLLVVLAVVTRSGLKWSGRRRIKRQEEKRSREKMKQDILDKIEEVTGEED